MFRAFDEWDAKLPNHLPYSLKEAALLFESGSYEMCDKNILVTAPHALKITRVTQRDNISEEQVLARMNKQFTDRQKLKLADYFIENNENQSIILQVLDLHQQFLELGK
ncbi:Dephospho-CoA kinase [compost metagenome]